jgi:hypothetical protein
MMEVAPEGAGDWRDISVLTPRVRRTLAVALGSRVSDWLEELYVSLNGRIASVYGLEGANQRELSFVGQAIDAATKRLPSMFERPKQGWSVRIVNEAKESSAGDLSLVVVGARLRHLLERAVDGRHLKIGLMAIEEAAPNAAPLAGIVFEARDQESEREARHASASRNLMMIAVGTSRDGIADHGPTMIRDFPAGRIDLPNAGAFRFGRPQSTDANAVRLAAAVAIELKEGLYEAPHPRTALVRVAGEADHPGVLAALYGRAWALGLAPWKSIHVVDRNKLGRSFRDETVRRALFDEVPVVGGELVSSIGGAAGIVDCSGRGGFAPSRTQRGHASPCAKLADGRLQHHRWPRCACGRAPRLLPDPFEGARSRSGRRKVDRERDHSSGHPIQRSRNAEVAASRIL